MQIPSYSDFTLMLKDLRQGKFIKLFLYCLLIIFLLGIVWWGISSPKIKDALSSGPSQSAVGSQNTQVAFTGPVNAPVTINSPQIQSPALFEPKFDPEREEFLFESKNTVIDKVEWYLSGNEVSARNIFTSNEKILKYSEFVHEVESQVSAHMVEDLTALSKNNEFGSFPGLIACEIGNLSKGNDSIPFGAIIHYNNGQIGTFLYIGKLNRNDEIVNNVRKINFNITPTKHEPSSEEWNSFLYGQEWVDAVVSKTKQRLVSSDFHYLQKDMLTGHCLDKNPETR